MRIALVADVHANREALTAVLAHARSLPVDQLVFLGDLVGYGPDPQWALDLAEAEVQRGALAVLGNHDLAIGDAREDLNPIARAALDWTRERLLTSHKAFLQRLPYQIEAEDRLYVHASGYKPQSWPYVFEPRDADLSFYGTDKRLTFVGHTHVAALFHVGPGGRAERFRPVIGTPVPLLKQRRWLGVIGSVGQSRDGQAAAAYAVLDEDATTLTYFRVPYDVATTVKKVRAAGLPETLARRLLAGR